MKRILAAMLAAVVACGFSGCKNENDTEEATSVSQSETSFDAENWLSDDYLVVKCNGIDISFPCKLSDFNDKFRTEITKADENSVTDTDWIDIYFNDEYVGAMCYKDNNYNKETDNLSFIRLNTFDLYGLSENSTKEDVQKLLGAGDEMDNEYADAYYGDNIRVLFEYLNNKTSVSIYNNGL
ncbi:MAG: hypothetical protein J6A05_11170 [Oscillospiraceae bacterium]|nr:hypothetical protein [Oscillospiraceae bacterium]